MTALSPFYQVGEFHQVFGHPLETEPQVNLCNQNPKLANFRYSLIEEEIKEFEEGYQKSDYLECVDALCDTLYVIYGACHVFGMLGIDDIKPVELNDKTNVVDLENPKEWFNKNAEMVNAQITLLNTLLAELKSGIDTNDFSKIYNVLRTMTNELYQIGSTFNVFMDKAFAEVHRSNMTKVCTKEEDAKETVKWYLENEKRYESPAYRKSVLDKYWVIYDANTSKILKSIYFGLPKLENFVNRTNA